MSRCDSDDKRLPVAAESRLIADEATDAPFFGAEIRNAI